jgi:hypothetical protein
MIIILCTKQREHTHELTNCTAGRRNQGVRGGGSEIDDAKVLGPGSSTGIRRESKDTDALSGEETSKAQ